MRLITTPVLAFGLSLASVVGGCSSARPPATSPSGASASAGSSQPLGLIGLPDGRRLDVTCIGSGNPVVVLDAGLGNTSDVWIPVADLVGSFATVCRYDRAGLGRSDPRPEPHGAASAVADLHALLQAANLPAPYVVVGASFGGLDVQLFARTYPADTAGVVLVDAIPPEWNAGLEALLTPAQVAERHAIPNGEPMTNDDLRASDAAVLAAPPFPPVKLVVLRHDIPFPGDAGWPTAKVEALWAGLQAGLAAASPDGVLIQARNAGHRIHQDQPALVADAIHAVVDPGLWPPGGPATLPVDVAFGSGAPPVGAGVISGYLIYSAPDGLRRATMDGTDSTLVVASDGMVVGEPSIDAAGRFLAYTRQPIRPAASGPHRDQPAELWVLDITNGTGTMVAPDAELPAVSPDGALIAFGREGHTWLVGRDGSGLHDLGEGGCAVWSPDGSRLAMCSRDDMVFVLRPSDGSRLPVFTGPGPYDPTAWLPDGDSLVLISARDGDGDGEIYLVGVDGSDLHRLTQAPGNQDAVAWTKAGLLVTSSLPGADVSDWFVVDPGTGSARAIPWMHGVPIPVAYLPGP
jgi:pimeloyl-ACP methyl ester carboxylesterase